MKFLKATYIAGLLCSLLTTAIQLSAQDAADHKQQHHHYKLIDIGTFGGPNSGLPGYPPAPHVLNPHGVLVGLADTPTPDPNFPNCLTDCFASHAFEWRNGVLTDLGALPGVNVSFSQWISDDGLVVGASENGVIDPLTGFPEMDAVLWNDGQMINLGTLGGNASEAGAVNNRGQVVGAALNTIPDTFTTGFIVGFGNAYFLTTGFGAATQEHAFLWEDGVMKDLGTLGGTDSAAGYINERGQIAGESYTNSTINPLTGAPTLDPFLWVRCDRDRWDSHDCENDPDSSTARNGEMLDLGTLGGTYGYPYWLSNRGQVVGQSNLAGDLTFHPFLWHRGVMTDLGTLGGKTGAAFRVSERGAIVGYADLPNASPDCKGLACVHHAFLWKDGEMADLGTIAPDPCSRALSINSSGQIVGASIAVCGGGFTHAFLWENGGPAVDLNTLVPPGSELELTGAIDINDRGEIAGLGVLSNGDEHVFLLKPREEDDPDCWQPLPTSTGTLVEKSLVSSEYPAARRWGSESPAKTINRLQDQ